MAGSGGETDMRAWVDRAPPMGKGTTSGLMCMYWPCGYEFPPVELITPEGTKKVSVCVCVCVCRCARVRAGGLAWCVRRRTADGTPLLGDGFCIAVVDGGWRRPLVGVLAEGTNKLLLQLV